MAFQVKRICEKNQIESCEQFAINHYLWANTCKPKAYGWLGYLEGQGLYVKLVCEEKDPVRHYKNNRDRVCEESAMEFFLAFADEGQPVSNDGMYINFEMNANGALYSKVGRGRKNRQFISEELCQEIGCKAVVEEEKWSLEMLIPETFLKEVSDFERIKAGNPFYFNFYKISENKDIEHYGSYTMIDSETPNFHLPVCFKEAVIV